MLKRGAGRRMQHNEAFLIERIQDCFLDGFCDKSRDKTIPPPFHENLAAWHHKMPAVEGRGAAPRDYSLRYFPFQLV